MRRSPRSVLNAELPVVVEQRLWRLPRQQDPAKAYSTYRASPLIIEVHEQGVVLGRVRLKKADADQGEFRVEDGWLVVRTYPRRAKQEAAAEQLRREEGAQRAAAARAPAFRALLAAFSDELGAYEKRRACDVTVYAFEPPARRRCPALLARARAAGAAASVVDTGHDRKLLVAAGGSHRAAAFFPWNHYGPGALEPAFLLLDADAGLTVNEVDQWGAFTISLDRVPKAIEPHAKAMAAIFNLNQKAVGAALKQKRLTASLC